MAVVGDPSHPLTAPSVDLTRYTVQKTVGTADIALSTVFTVGYCRRVVPQASGTVFIKRKGDAAAVSHVAVAGQPIDGHIVLIGGTTNYSTASAIAINLEI